MYKFRIFFVLILAVVSTHVFAQDRMYKKNGEIVEINLIRLSPSEITFKRFDRPDGPEYTIPKGDVMKIRYANGSSDVFEENNDRIGVNDEGRPVAPQHFVDKRSAPKDQNIIAVAPIVFTENGHGFGFTYERTLDKRGWVSLYCPFYLTYSSNNNSGTSGTQSTDNFFNPMYYLEPGIKFYTNLNSLNRMKHSLGLNLVLGLGSNTASNYDYYTGNTVNTNSSRALVGALVGYGGNMFPTNHLYLGYSMGLGMTYVNDYGGVSHPVAALFEASIRCGYRFAKTAK